MMMRYMLPSLCRWEPMFVIIFGMLWKKLVCFCIRCPTLGIIMFLGQYICVWVIIHSWASFWVWVTLITRYQNQSDPSSLLRFILIQASFRRIFIPVHLLCFISLNLFHHLLPFDLLFITIVNYLVRTSSPVHHDLILDFPSWIVHQSHQSELGFPCFYLRFKLISSILSTDSLIWVISESFICFRSRFLVSDQSWSCYPIDWGIDCVSPPAEFVVRRSLLGVRCVAVFDLCWSLAALFRLISSFSELTIFSGSEVISDSSSFDQCWSCFHRRSSLQSWLCGGVRLRWSFAALFRLFLPLCDSDQSWSCLWWVGN